MIGAVKFRNLLEILHIIGMKMSQECFDKIMVALIEEVEKIEVDDDLEDAR